MLHILYGGKHISDIVLYVLFFICIFLHIFIKVPSEILTSSDCFFLSFFAVLGIDHGALCLLGRYCTA
jgi:hypothetical protein